jgi:hypothetical protein
MSVPPGDRPLLVAFYLPQFHPVPENDSWWGRGFTEWTNVVQARPLFEGHEQPHLPADLGFYDLRLPEVRELQASMASAHGVDAFCYYHYWFGGRRVLHRPFDEVRRTGRPGLPFMLCWANENWTRAWDASDHEVLLEQSYDPEERAAHVAYLVDAFRDERYLRIDGRPAFGIYRIGALPDAAGFVAALREGAVAAGVGDPFVVKFDTHGNFDDPALTGCDVASQFFPHGSREVGLEDRQIDVGAPGNVVVPYGEVARALLDCPAPAWTRYECVTPGWDNTARRGAGRSWIVHGSTPEAYERWLRAVLDRAPTRTDGTPVVFVNAWNEWAEGAHLEPDLRWGDSYLRATARAALGAEPLRPDRLPPLVDDLPEAAPCEDRYREVYERCTMLQARLSSVELAAQRRVDRVVAQLEEQLRDEREVAARLARQVERLLDTRPGAAAETADPDR